MTNRQLGRGRGSRSQGTRALLGRDARLQSTKSLLRLAEIGDAVGVTDALSRGAELDFQNDDGNTALMLAALGGQYETVACLLGAGAAVELSNHNGDTPLIAAAGQGDIDTVRALVMAGANVQAQNKNHNTALIVAADYGHTATVVYLIDSKADVNHKNQKMYTALIFASAEGHAETVAALLGAGAVIDCGDRLDGMALILASQEGHIDTVRALVRGGVSLNMQDVEYGDTALIRAVEFGRVETVRCLLDAEADWTIENEDGVSPLQWARKVLMDPKPDPASYGLTKLPPPLTVRTLIDMMESWEECVARARLAMLMLARRAALLVGSSGAKLGQLGGLSDMPGEILRKIGMMVFVPWSVWRRALGSWQAAGPPSRKEQAGGGDQGGALVVSSRTASGRDVRMNLRRSALDKPRASSSTDAGSMDARLELALAKNEHQQQLIAVDNNMIEEQRATITSLRSEMEAMGAASREQGRLIDKYRDTMDGLRDRIEQVQGGAMEHMRVCMDDQRDTIADLRSTVRILRDQLRTAQRTANQGTTGTPNGQHKVGVGESIE